MLGYISLEKSILNNSIKVETFCDIIIPKIPKIIFIEDLQHAVVVFPDGHIFNCNPRDYPLPIEKEMTDGLTSKQVEPPLEEYENYWDISEQPLIENDQNCLLWCDYYLDWSQNKTIDTFPCLLCDLENWCRNVIAKIP